MQTNAQGKLVHAKNHMSLLIIVAFHASIWGKSTNVFRWRKKMDDTAIHPVRFTRRQVKFLKLIMTTEHTFEEWCNEIFDAIEQAEKEDECWRINW